MLAHSNLCSHKISLLRYTLSISCYRSEQEADVLTRRLAETSASLDRVKMESSLEIEKVAILLWLRVSGIL